MKKLLTLCLLLLCVGCVGNKFRPDTVYTEQSTYGSHNYYSEYGISGPISDRVRLDLFIVPQFNVTDHESNKISLDNIGGGFRLEFDIGKK
jgi:hypothetical protein